MRLRVTGYTTSDCRARAASAVGLSPCRQAKAGWGHLPRCWTRPATASKDSSLRSSSPNNWAWTCSSPSLPGMKIDLLIFKSLSARKIIGGRSPCESGSDTEDVTKVPVLTLSRIEEYDIRVSQLYLFQPP